MPTRQYRIRVFDNGYELLGRQRYATALDLDTTEGLEHARSHLAWVRPRLVAAAVREDSTVQPERVRLVLHDWDTGEHVLDWMG